MCLICLIFFVIMLINCTRERNDIFQAGFSLIPGDQFLYHFNKVTNDPNAPLFQAMLNSAIISIGTVICSVYFSAMTAYGVHVYDFKGRKFVFNFILLVMTIPTQVTAMGFYRLVYGWGLDNNFIPLIIPAIAAPTVFFFMKQYMDSSLPLDIVEAARIDGANEFRTFNEIILPILKPAMAVQGIFTFVSSWNNLFLPQLLLTEKHMKTLPIVVSFWKGATKSQIDYGDIYMVIALSIMPVVIVYLCLSKFIVGGVTLGAVKG